MDVNNATELITEVSRQDLIGKDFSNYFTEPRKAREGYQQVFKEGFVTDYPLTIRSTTGKLTDVLYNASVYKDDKGNVLGVFAAARDYSRVKQTTQQLEESNKDLETFSYSISHDLRAPLRAINSYAKILEEDHSPKLDSEGKRLLQTIETNAQQMGKLIDDLLSFSRTGRQQMKIESVNNLTLVKNVIDDLKKTSTANVNFQIKEILSAQGDSSLLKQVWVNLLSNAIKFTKSKEKPIVEIGSNGDVDNITYYVKDNGIGFDMKYKNKLFQVFQRLHDPQEYEGTGVGLALVQHIVNRHGGKSWADGKTGEGATFYFTLPRIYQSEKSAMSLNSMVGR